MWGNSGDRSVAEFGVPGERKRREGDVNKASNAFFDISKSSN